MHLSRDLKIILPMIMYGGTATAQTLLPLPTVVPPRSEGTLAETAACPPTGSYYFNNTAPPCIVDGSRSVITQSETVTPVDGHYSTLTGVYDVNYSGNLRPFNPSRRQNGQSGVNDLTVNGTFAFTGSYNNEKVPTPWTAAGTDPLGFANYSNQTFLINSINGIFRYCSSCPGGVPSGYDRNLDYTFNVVNPNDTSQGLSRTLTGRFGTVNPAGGLTYGQISGTVMLSLPTADGIIAYKVLPVATVTTVLNENGLVTPTINVRSGINMGNSRISNLQAGLDQSDAVNVAQLAAEAQARADGDAKLAQQISQIPTSSGGVTAADLGVETAARIAGDNALASSLSAETAARVAADTNISQRIEATNTMAAQTLGALQSETNARLAADISQSSRIDILATRLDQIDSRLSVMDSRIASSTAVAVAMGGATFIPGMKFNLSANVATYEGAHAGSLQIAALVSPNIAVNAGVASGLNRGGKTAARAGITLGF